MNKGILYGTGVGPGDPELLTLKAVRLIRECDVIAIPQKKERCFALRIAEGAVQEIREKPLLELEMPMTRDPEVREKAWKSCAALLREQLDAGKTVVFLTLGDPSVYSTYGYLRRLLREEGYDVRMAAGVPSFCAVSAALGMPLCEDGEALHIFPGSSADFSEALSLPGTKVFMKGNLPALKEALRDYPGSVQGASNCGTGGEALYRSPEEIPEGAGYYTTVIAKEKEQ